MIWKEGHVEKPNRKVKHTICIDGQSEGVRHQLYGKQRAKTGGVSELNAKQDLGARQEETPGTLFQVPAISAINVKMTANNPEMTWTKETYLLWAPFQYFSFSNKMKIFASFFVFPIPKMEGHVLTLVRNVPVFYSFS